MRIRDILHALAVLICGTAVSSAQFLINPYAFAASAPAFTPPAGNVLWLNADTVSGADGSSVATWPDDAGSNDATQATSGKQPTIEHGEINGHKVIRLDQFDDGMITALTVNRPYTIIIAVRPYDDARIINSSTNNSIIGVTRAANTVYLGGDVRTSAYGVSGTPVIVCLRVSASLATTLHEDGVDITSGSPASANWGTLTLGSEGLFPEAAESDLAEVFVFDSYLSASDVNLVQAYLGTKYSISVTAL